MADTVYKRAKKAKAEIHEINRLGWPDTEEGIRNLFAEMEEDQRVVCLCGRFVKRWNGWRFQFPSTVKVIEALQGNVDVEPDMLFVEDEEG